ncbi:MAG: hypothetical protein Q8K55_10330, partial [Gemmatimonadaceae bacterium]|nr:hypothetical protein [Gemmatimonadaceae bacterium]
MAPNQPKTFATCATRPVSTPDADTWPGTVRRPRFVGKTDPVASHPSPRSENLAAIDLGTNSVHGVVARMTETESGVRFEILEREKEVVRLGESAGDMRELSDDAIDRAVAALDRFRRVAEVHDA